MSKEDTKKPDTPDDNSGNSNTLLTKYEQLLLSRRKSVYQGTFLGIPPTGIQPISTDNLLHQEGGK